MSTSHLLLRTRAPRVERVVALSLLAAALIIGCADRAPPAKFPEPAPPAIATPLPPQAPESDEPAADQAESDPPEADEGARVDDSAPRGEREPSGDAAGDAGAPRQML